MSACKRSIVHTCIILLQEELTTSRKYFSEISQYLFNIMLSVV